MVGEEGRFITSPHIAGVNKVCDLIDDWNGAEL